MLIVIYLKKLNKRFIYYHHLTFETFTFDGNLQEVYRQPLKHPVKMVQCFNATLYCLSTCFIILCVFTSELSTQSTVTVPWYENLPAVAMDYKVHIDPGKEDCYFQYVNPGATFYVSFQVIFN